MGWLDDLEKRKLANIVIRLANQKLSVARCRAEPKYIADDVDGEYIWRLWQKQKGLCAYSGKHMSVWPNKNGDKQSKNPDIMTIDRKNSDKGYVKRNIVLCCWRANQIKSKYSLNEIKKYFGAIL